MGDIAAQRDSFKTLFAAIILFIRSPALFKHNAWHFTAPRHRDQSLRRGFVEHEIETSDDASLSANKFHQLRAKCIFN
jgi:hypothetical protein